MPLTFYNNCLIILDVVVDDLNDYNIYYCLNHVITIKR